MSASELAYLLSPRAVRERATAALALADAGELLHFRVDWARLPEVVARVLATTGATYPDFGAIPPHSRWRHFDVGGVDRGAALADRLRTADPAEALRARFDLVVPSVLLDAGAGPTWRFREPGTGLVFARSEGLAVASYHLFIAGGFSSAPETAPLRADAAGLRAIDELALARAFQVDAGNELTGVPGRVALLRKLGETIAGQGGGGGARIGDLADRLRAGAAAAGGKLKASALLAAVLGTLGPIWPGRHTLAGVNLGDTWPHPKLGLVPFHKLSQWLTYSLIEPLAAAGIEVVDLDALTGLAEYRNGGLFLDGGLIVPRDPAILNQVHQVGSTVVVEWRALTVALLDRVAAEVRRALGADAATLPLARILEGGTWRAGREIAAERRAGGTPPLSIESDGTVF